MRFRLEAWNRRRKKPDGPPIKTGIGISTCKVVVEQIGLLGRFVYPVIGDGVNVDVRLEGLTKQIQRQFDSRECDNLRTMQACENRLPA